MASILGVGGRDPQIFKWVRVREGKEWEWEGKTPRLQNRLTLLSGTTNKRSPVMANVVQQLFVNVLCLVTALRVGRHKIGCEKS
jgi:hypothetical protein